MRGKLALLSSAPPSVCFRFFSFAFSVPSCSVSVQSQTEHKLLVASLVQTLFVRITHRLRKAFKLCKHARFLISRHTWRSEGVHETVAWHFPDCW